MINHLVSSGFNSFDLGFVDNNFRKLPDNKDLLVIYQLLANPAFTNKELLKSTFIKTLSIRQAIIESFNHRGITLEAIRLIRNNHKLISYLEDSLLRGYYNPYVWDLFTYMLSKDYPKSIGEFSFTDRGLVVGFLSCDSKGRFEGGQVIANNSKYELDCYSVVKFKTSPDKDTYKEFMCFIPVQSIIAWYDQVIQATEAQVVGLTYSSAKYHNLKEKIKEVTKPTDTDIIKVPYELDSAYYTFWNNHD